MIIRTLYLKLLGELTRVPNPSMATQTVKLGATLSLDIRDAKGKFSVPQLSKMIYAECIQNL